MVSRVLEAIVWNGEYVSARWWIFRFVCGRMLSCTVLSVATYPQEKCSLNDLMERVVGKYSAIPLRV